MVIASSKSARVLAVDRDGDVAIAKSVLPYLFLVANVGGPDPALPHRLVDVIAAMPCLRMMTSVSTPGSSIRPRTSTMPTGPRAAVG